MMYRSPSEPSGQATIVDGPSLRVSALPAPACHVPVRLLQSAFALNVWSDLNVIVYFAWSADGTLPWNAGSVMVIDASCHGFLVRPAPGVGVGLGVGAGVAVGLGVGFGVGAGVAVGLAVGLGDPVGV